MAQSPSKSLKVKARIEIRVAEPDVPRATALPHGSLGVALNCPRPPLGAAECYKLDVVSLPLSVDRC